jgi:hypothetical protein
MLAATYFIGWHIKRPLEQLDFPDNNRVTDATLDQCHNNNILRRKYTTASTPLEQLAFPVSTPVSDATSDQCPINNIFRKNILHTYTS